MAFSQSDQPARSGPGDDPRPPLAERRPDERVVHGVTLGDDFAWLKASNWQEVLRDPRMLPADIRAYLEAENAYGAALLAPLAGLRERLVAEMRGRMKEDDSSVPLPFGPFQYYRRYRAGAQHPLLCRRPRTDGPETILLDAEALARGQDFFQLGDTMPSPDHALYAWSADDTGSEFYTLRLRDIATCRDLPDTLIQTSGAMVWAQDGRSLFYVEIDEHHRPRRVRRHRLGTPQADDALIHEETQDGWFVDIAPSQSGQFMIIAVADHETSEALLVDLFDGEPAARLVARRETGIRYSVEPHGDRLLILTNADGAEDFKLVETPLADMARSAWRDVVPHRPGILLLSHTPYRRFLARMERENSRPRIVLTDFTTGTEQFIAFPEDTYSLWLEEGYEYDTTTLRFVYSSMTTPSETYDYDIASGARALLKRQDIPSGHDPGRYETRLIFAGAPDGEQIPISVLYAKDTPLDGQAPCLLYGYGAYGVAMSAHFDARRLSLADRGFVFAIAHIRGGTDKGWRWYLDGKRERKINTFSDFIACAQALCEQGFTARGRIVAQGRSAGGMLMGAAANMAPELFRAILAEVPFVDVLNTMLDASLPLTPPEWPEWGNPIASKADFDVIRAYSPYDQIRARVYPAILAIGGLADPRVTYWEPAKWVAKLRATMTGGGPVLLQTEMEAGHGGASGRFDRLREVALSYAFAIGAVAGDLAAPPRQGAPADET